MIWCCQWRYNNANDDAPSIIIFNVAIIVDVIVADLVVHVVVVVVDVVVDVVVVVFVKKEAADKHLLNISPFRKTILIDNKIEIQISPEMPKWRRYKTKKVDF